MEKMSINRAIINPSLQSEIGILESYRRCHDSRTNFGTQEEHVGGSAKVMELLIQLSHKE
jgi:hypothetical protein